MKYFHIFSYPEENIDYEEFLDKLDWQKSPEKPVCPRIVQVNYIHMKIY